MGKQFRTRATADEMRQAMEAGPSSEPASNDRDIVVQLLRNLLEMQGVPFYYIVPDATMLPVESIRFFQVDENWLTVMADGALSLGGTAAATGTAQVKTEARERVGESRKQALKLPLNKINFTTMSGFVLRSSVVSGWPGLEVEAFDAGSTKLAIIRFEMVAPTVMFALFEGNVASIKLHEPGEGIHFGTATPTDVTEKNLRYAADGLPGSGITIGQPIDGGAGSDFTITQFRGYTETTPLGPNRVMSMDALAAYMAPLVYPTGVTGNFTSAEFALEMVQGVECVTFNLQNS
jgi:hypothetical protein